MSVELIERHLSGEQMTEIAAEEWRLMCRNYFENNKSTAISNICYPMVREMISEILGADADAQIAAKAVEVINGLSSYTVFHQPDIYDRNPSPAWEVLQSVVRENRDAIEARIKHHIHNLSKADALEIITSGKITIEVGVQK